MLISHISISLSLSSTLLSRGCGSGGSRKAYKFGQIMERRMVNCAIDSFLSSFCVGRISQFTKLRVLPWHFGFHSTACLIFASHHPTETKSRLKIDFPKNFHLTVSSVYSPIEKIPQATVLLTLPTEFKQQGFFSFSPQTFGH
jgi:hypothetical protein